MINRPAQCKMIQDPGSPLVVATPYTRLLCRSNRSSTAMIPRGRPWWVGGEVLSEWPG